MYIKGAYCTRYGKTEKTSYQLAYEAIQESLKDAQLKIEEIDAIMLANLDFSSGERQRHLPVMLSSMLHTNIPILRIPAACASGGTALWNACHLKDHDNILVVGTEKLTGMSTEQITDEFMMANHHIIEQQQGVNFPAMNALVAQQYMDKYQATIDDLALVAFKNHKNAFLNPKAKFYNKEVTLKQIKQSQVVASPLRLYDCSISVDGAAALVLTKEKTDVEIAGSALATDAFPFEQEQLTSFKATKVAAKKAYEQADIEPRNLRLLEVHDAFTILELISYEDLGICKPGEAKELIKAGETNMKASKPVNVSGGLKAKGHPLSATGIGQVAEIFDQMKLRAGKRQLENIKYGLAHNIGGIGGTVTVHILKKLGDS